MRAEDDGGEFTGPATRTLIASLVTLFFGGTVAIGLFPLLMAPVSATFGWSRGQMGAMAGVSALAAAIGMLIWGTLADRYRARAMLLPGLAATSGAFLLLATQSGNLIYGAFCYLLIGFFGAMSVVHVKAQSAQFGRRRGVVLAMIGVAVGLSFGVTPLLAKPILDGYGWRAVYTAFAVPPAAIGLPLVFAWFRDGAPASPGASAAPAVPIRRSLATRGFWIVVLFSGCSSFVFIGLQAHVVAVLTERGLSTQIAVETLSVAMVATLACQMASGWLLDRFRSPRVAFMFVGAQMAGVIVLAATSGPIGTIAGILLLNAGAGGELSMLPYLLSRLFGVAQLAKLYGIAALCAQVLGGLSPVLLGVIHDRTGSYAPALPVFAAVLTIGFVLILLMPRFPAALSGRPAPR